MLNIIIVLLILASLTAHRYLTMFQDQGLLPFHLGFCFFAILMTLTYLVSFVWMLGVVAGSILSALCLLGIIYGAFLWPFLLPWLRKIKRTGVIPRVNGSIYAGFSFLVVAATALTIANFFVSPYKGAWHQLGGFSWSHVAVFAGLLVTGFILSVIALPLRPKDPMEEFYTGKDPVEAFYTGKRVEPNTRNRDDADRRDCDQAIMSDLAISTEAFKAKVRASMGLDDEESPNERYLLSDCDRGIIASACELLRKIIRSEGVSPAQREAVDRTLGVLKWVPEVSEDMDAVIQLDGPDRYYGEHEISHSWEVRIEEQTIEISAGGYFYRQSTGGDSFTSMKWEAWPGSPAALNDLSDTCRIVDDLMPFDAEIAEIDLSEPGYSLTVYLDGEELEGEESLGKAP